MYGSILFLTFLSVTLLVYGIYLVVFHKRIRILERIKIYITANVGSDDNTEKPKTPFRLHNLINLFGKIIPLKKYLIKKRRKLAQASILMKPEEFLGISVLSAILGALLFYVLLKIGLIIIPGFAIGFIIPDLFLYQMKRNRVKKLNRQLPEALNMISNGIRAGFSFTQAMSAASIELSAPISDEFKRVIRDNSLGKPMEEALLNMAYRTEDEDVEMLVSALNIQRQVGGNLTEILDIISHTIRERVKIKGEIKTLTASSKLSAWVISIVPIAIAIIIMIINPDYIKIMFTSSIGILMLITSVIMELIGVFLLVKIVNIDI